MPTDPIIVAFQGTHGAYSEEAIHQHFGESVGTLPCDSFTDLFKAVDSAVGRTPENPLPRFQLEAKYRDCAGRALTAEGVNQSLDLLSGMETLEHVSTLSDTLSAECRFAQRIGPAILARAS